MQSLGNGRQARMSLLEANFRLIRLISQTIRFHAYSLSRKTVNTRENFWNVNCFVTNQIRDETAKDNRQTAAYM